METEIKLVVLRLILTAQIIHSTQILVLKQLVFSQNFDSIISQNIKIYSQEHLQLLKNHQRTSSIQQEKVSAL